MQGHGGGVGADYQQQLGEGSGAEGCTNGEQFMIRAHVI